VENADTSTAKVAHDTADLMPSHFFKKTIAIQIPIGNLGIERVKLSRDRVVKTLVAIDVDAEFLRQS
jgi:hypothetical protein